MELVSNLREMSDVLRSNAELLLHDIQKIHSRMVGELEQHGVDSPGAAGESSPSADESVPAADESSPPADEDLQLPEFLRRG